MPSALRPPLTLPPIDPNNPFGLPPGYGGLFPPGTLLPTVPPLGGGGNNPVFSLDPLEKDDKTLWPKAPDTDPERPDDKRAVFPIGSVIRIRIGVDLYPSASDKVKEAEKRLL